MHVLRTPDYQSGTTDLPSSIKRHIAKKILISSEVVLQAPLAVSNLVVVTSPQAQHHLCRTRAPSRRSMCMVDASLLGDNLLQLF